MVAFFELRDASLPNGVATSGPSARVVIVDGSEELARWLLGLATPPPGVLFLRGRDVSARHDVRVTCAVGAGYLPGAADITLAEWVIRAAHAADRPTFTIDDAHAVLADLGLLFLARTALAFIPADVRPRASLAAGLASNRPILVADATTGFAKMDSDAVEAKAWERWCAGRDVVLFVPPSAARGPFLAAGWVVVGEVSAESSGLGESWRLDTSAASPFLLDSLRAAGFTCLVVDGLVYVRRNAAGEPTIASIAATLRTHSIRLREAVSTPTPPGPWTTLDD